MTPSEANVVESGIRPARLFPLSPEHRKYILADFAFGAIPNALISAAAAYLIFRHSALVPLWGAQGIAFDLAPTVFMVTLMQLIICTVLTRNRIQAGAVPAIGVSRRNIPILRMLPNNVVLRGLVVALPTTVILLPLSIIAMLALEIDSMSLSIFVVFKTACGPAIGLVTAPIVYLAALSDMAVRGAEVCEPQ